MWTPRFRAPSLRRTSIFSFTALALFAGGCAIADPTAPATDEAFLAVITKTDGPAEISAGGLWTVRIRRLDVDASLDTTITITPGDTVILRLPLDSYDVLLGGVPIACTDRMGFARRRFLGVPGATFTIRFNVFCNTFLALHVATFAAQDAELDDEYVYRLTDGGGDELRVGVLSPVDTVLFDDVVPGDYALELSHVDPECVVVSSGGRRHSFTIDPPHVAVIRYQVDCSNPSARPRITHLGSSYRDGQSVFYLEAVDPDPDGAGPRVPDIDAYYWAITDCARNEVLAVRPRRGLSAWGAATRAADTVRLAVTVPVGLSNEEMAGKCTSLRVTDLMGNSSAFAEERIGNELGSAPVSTGSTAFLDLTGTRLDFAVQAFDPDDDFAGSFQRFTFRDGTFGTPDGLPDVLSRNIYGYGANAVIPAFDFTDYSFTLEDLLNVRMTLVDREGNFSQIEDADFGR